MDNTNLRKVGVVLGVVLVIFVVAKTLSEFKAMPYIGKTTPTTNVITVSGKGEVLATPDIATFSFGVTEEAQTVESAQKNATEKMNAILDYIKKDGVSEKDVKTTLYNIYPRYEYRATSAGAPYYGSGKQVLAAYVVSQKIEVKVRKLTDAGKFLSGIGEFGATDVSGLTFTRDDQDKLVREARDKAIQNARGEAKALAKSLGIRLGDMISFSDNQGYPGPVYYAKSATIGMGGGESAPMPEIPAGENKIVSNVTITYEIK